MRVLMISGDHNLARAGTGAHARFMLQAGAVDALELVVWPKQFWKPFLIKGPFDVVTSQDPFWRGLAAWVAAKRLGAKLNIQVHADLRAQSFVKHTLGNIILRHADTVRVVSQKIKEQVMPLTNAEIEVLPVYVDLKKFEHLQKVPHARFGKVILWIGRFEEEKDPLFALKVLRDVREFSVDAGLVMLGDGSLNAALHRQAKKMQLEGHIQFPGWQDPLLYLSQADVVLCTSQAESFGASMVEALSAGIPVVAPDVGVAREAGAAVAPKEYLAQKTAEILREGVRGRLALSLLGEQEWVHAWKDSL